MYQLSAAKTVTVKRQNARKRFAEYAGAQEE